MIYPVSLSAIHSFTVHGKMFCLSTTSESVTRLTHSPVRVDDGAIPIGGDDPDGNGRHEDGNGLDRDDALAKPLHVRPEGPLLVEGLPQRYWKRAAVGIEWNGGRREKETASSMLHRCAMHLKKCESSTMHLGPDSDGQNMSLEKSFKEGIGSLYVNMTQAEARQKIQVRSGRNFSQPRTIF